MGYYVLAASESCPRGSAEEWHLNPLATLGHATTALAPIDSQSLTSPGSAAHSSCPLSSSTTYPRGSNASVTQLRHPRLSLVLIQEPRVRN
jgi:hypothetical protein